MRNKLVYSAILVSFLLSETVCQSLGFYPCSSLTRGLDSENSSECCTKDAFNYLYSKDLFWPNRSNETRSSYISELRSKGYCRISSSTFLFSTTEELTTTLTISETSTTDFDSTTAETTSVPTTTTSIQCGVLANTSCCNLKVTECLSKQYEDWRNVTLIKGYERELEKCDCVLTSSSTETEIASTTSLPTTTSPSLNCYWLSEPSNFSEWIDGKQTNLRYNGGCCSETSIQVLNSSDSTRWILTTSDSWNKANALINLLYCTPNACPQQSMLWTNCSNLSTTTSSSTMLSSTTLLTTETETRESSSTGSTQTTTPSTEPSTTITTPMEQSSTVSSVQKTRTSEDKPSSSTTVPTSASTSESSTSSPMAETSSSSTTSQSSPASTSTVPESSTVGSTPTTGLTTLSTNEQSTSTSSGGHSTSTFGTTSETPETSTDFTATSTSSSSDSSTQSSNAQTSTIENGSTTTNFTSAPSTSSTPATPTTTYNWPTGGTTWMLPSGEIVLSESLIAYPNCTTVLMQLIYNPRTKETRTEITSDAEGCKKTSSTPTPSSTSVHSTTATPSTTPGTTTYNWPTGGTTRMLPSGEIILSESLIAYPNCTTVLMQLIYNPSTKETRTETTTDADGCKKTSSTSSSTPSLKHSTTPTPTPGTTTYNWPTGGTTRMLPSGEIILSESLIAYPNCTTVLMQLIYTPSTNKTRTETTTDTEGCKKTSTISSSSSKFSITPTPTPSSGTTTYNWPTGGTTRTLPSGEIILSESLIAFQNCTTVLMQLIYNPSTNKTRTETTTDAEGCKKTSSTSKISTTPTSPTSSKPTPTSTSMTTTYNWPTGGTTRTLPSGEIILSESLIAYKNCTTVLMQLIYNPSTNKTRTETTTDAQGCKATSSTSLKPTSPSSSTASPPTTTYNWPTGGTTRTLPSGEIILSESLIAYKNCTTVLMQLIYNPSTNKTRTETTTDAQGCKATITTPTPITTTYNWPTGGTTRTLPSGEIILSESLIAYKNCTTVLMQLIYNPSTNKTRTETTSDAQGCKATSTTQTPTTFNWPTGGTTRTLPSGEIILSESLIAYKNCTTVLMQLIYNPSKNTTRTETTSDAEGCKATSSGTTSTMSPGTTGGTTVSRTTNSNNPIDSSTLETTTFAWPTGGTTRMLPSGEIIISESLTAFPNCTTVLKQLVYNPTTNTTRTDTISDSEGCKATSTAKPTTVISSTATCSSLNLNLNSTTRPTSSEIKDSYSVGEKIYHICEKDYSFEIALQPLKIYQCLNGGAWSGTPEKCVATGKSEL
ncbi:uncharacterized protein CELE_F26C11.3 [Caenorhabditis elegans]|uniref:Isoform c of Uncharacterized protein F26C11.3 n=1 Tax=Caenorhabditis elegans TaxID=6239 RepID=Q09550-8|nr:Uncharacterized protein CELE_F26C11.3 [Caenorhabditis elegans]CAR31486.3 Uncharacterized protein CELE_F26C11.3 [Caenorhabditis elegans]